MNVRTVDVMDQAATSVHESTLDEQSLDRLFSEIAAAGTTQVFFRDGRPSSLKLTADNELAVAREALRRQTTRGIQLRYRGRDAEHWDTLTPDPAGAARLVRLRFAA
ncbi:MAG TPA: hypothetical protein VFH68_13295 [Polyangia bacterium]|jgi:hypothetical protein|nr:hypothetical protein [Polyangia bacterium]